jgi:serine/threonine protein kinase
MVPASPDSSARRAPETAPLLLVDGRVVAGRYRLSVVLGKGAQGTVFQATQIELDRRVAIKLLSGDVSEEARERFVREVKITADLRHPGVAVVYDAGVTGEGQPYCAMELLSGETLAQRIAREGRIPAAELVPILAGVCSALDAVHAKRVIHRDIKPSNIFLARREDGGVDPKLIDFGIAKSFAVDVPEVIERATLLGLGKKRPPLQTVPGLIAGSPAYLSPEQIRGDVVDHRSDIHALGVTAYEALTGTLPFDASPIAALLARIVCEEPEPLRARAPDAEIPEPVAAVILRALAKEPERRPASAGELANALWAALAEAKGAKMPSARPLPAAPERRTRDVRGLVIAIAVVLAMVFAAWALRGTLRASPPPPSVAQGALSTPRPPAPPAPDPDPLPVEEPAPAPTGSDAPRVPALVRPRASTAPSSSAPPARIPTASPSADFRIDDLKTPF